MNQVIEQDQAGELAEHKNSNQTGSNITAVNPMQLLSMAVQQGASMERMEQLMSLQERWEANQARKAFDAAIAAARAKIKPIVKTAKVNYENKKTTGRTRYSHETLDGIAQEIDPILGEHGLSYRFRSRLEGRILHVTCVIAHKDGHSEETELSGGPDDSGNKNSYQAIGSAATYLQRYTLKLVLGLSAAKDDDAQGADAQEAESGGNTGSQPLTPAQMSNLRKAIAAAGITEEQMCAKAQVEQLQHMEQRRLNGALNYLKKLAQEDNQ